MAGQSARDIRRRIQSVRNMQQITRAMEMVAAAKLRRAEERAVAARPFAQKLREVLARLVASGDIDAAQGGLSLLQPRPEVRRVGLVPITADRGLAGPYNANVIRVTQERMRHPEREVGLVAIGRKGRDFFRKRGRKLEGEHVLLGDAIEYQTARQIADQLTGFYREGVFDEVYLIYNRFVSRITHRTVVERLLPVEAPAEAAESATDYLYEPTPEAVLGILVPRYVETEVYRALLEAKASEFGARMAAMRNASDNAEEMIRTLTLSMNRARQAAITKEIAEIVGGAEALTGAS